MRLEYPPGATPLDPDEIDGLIPSLSTQRQLNEFEAQNIADAQRWASNSSRLRSDLISVGGLRLLHERMFDDTWSWAGKFRQTEKNIGVDPARIQDDFNVLCGDVCYWIENGTYDWPEIAVRFHHRLVSIHPFPNGNGRHARLAANLLLDFNEQPRIPWGRGDLVNAGALRDRYLSALRKADNHDYAPLLEFAQSPR